MEYQIEVETKLNDQVDRLLKELPSFSKKFFYNLRSQNMSQRTRVQYAYDMKRFFDWIKESPAFSNINYKTCTAADILDPLTIDDIQEYMETLEVYYVTGKNGKPKKQLMSPSAKARRISSLRSFYKYYFKIGDIKNDLSNLIDIPKIPDKMKSVLDKKQVSRILKAVKNTEGLTEGELKRKNKTMRRDYAILMLFFGTGIRVSELVGIDWNDIDFYNGSLLVTRKGGDLDQVFFGPEVEEALTEYLDFDRDTLLAGNTEENAFFISMKHQRMGIRSVQEMIDNYAKKAGLAGKVTPHAMRRTFGTNLYEETGDIYLVADALHHSSVETTRKHYARMSEDHKRIAAEKSSTLFNK